MIPLCFLFLCLVSFPFCACREEGEACTITLEYNKTVTDIPGICLKLYNCSFAIKVLYDDRKKPPMCWWEDDLRVVCCPTENMAHRTGPFGNLYEPSSDGIKRSADTSCFYDGTLQLCCPQEPDAPLPKEAGCPALEIPNPPPHLNIAQRVAWDKCMENQRFVRKCVGRIKDRDRMKRVKRCFIPEDRFRVSGGQRAADNEFPHMAVLGLAEVIEKGATRDVLWVGGGSLISDRYILTATHVLIDTKRRPLRYAKLGCSNKTDVRSGVLYTIVRMKRHHLYDYFTNKHDIALLQLDRRVKLSEFVRPICLPVPGYRTHSNSRDIAGWGQTGENSDTSQVLLTTDVQLRADWECENEQDYDPSTMMCAKGEIKNSITSDSCHGDSGGPLMALLFNVDCSYSVEGVVSFGPRCGEGAPGVYTRVSYYLEWIVKNVWRKEWDEANRRSQDYY